MSVIQLIMWFRLFGIMSGTDLTPSGAGLSEWGRVLGALGSPPLIGGNQVPSPHLALTRTWSGSVQLGWIEESECSASEPGEGTADSAVSHPAMPVPSSDPRPRGQTMPQDRPTSAPLSAQRTFSDRSYARRAPGPSSQSASQRFDHPNAPGNSPEPIHSVTPVITTAVAESRPSVAPQERTVPKTRARKSAEPDIQASDRARGKAPAIELTGLAGDLDFYAPGRARLKLDRLGGDLFGLKRAVLELGANVGDAVLLSCEWITEAAKVASLETGREGEIDLDLGDRDDPCLLRRYNERRVRARLFNMKRSMR